MQRNMGKPQFILSGLCIALLTACGGGGNDMLLDKDGARPGFTGNDNSNVPLDPVGHNNLTKPVGIFVTAKDVGQQNSPTVVAVDNNDNGKIDSSDEVRFNQPGIVSEFCASDECQGFDAIKKQAQDLRENNPEQYQNSPLFGYAEVGNGVVIMRDINNEYHTLNTGSTIDYPNIATGIKDAGITKINKQRLRTDNGKPVDIPYGGSTDRLFNDILLFGLLNPNISKDYPYMNSYFRGSSTAGWSFQTFGYFFSNNLKQFRNVNVGFQSVGVPTQPKELPEEGKATYRGISQAFYNNQQVTMKNKIEANFSKRELDYTTTEPALYHTFESPAGEGTTGPIHVIEKRPDLNLTGHATWKKSVSDFEGDIHSGNGLHGKLQGQFYGPQAPEVGGVYGMQGTVDGQVIQYVGGFGAARD